MNPTRQIKPHPFTRIALPALLLAATALPGWAQSSTEAAVPRVDVRAPRVDARAVCPAFEADMLKALSRVAMQYREPGLLDVSFEIDGRHIDEVTVAGGPFGYRRATQRAVRSLECDNGNAGRQAVRLQVVFKDL